MQSTLLLQQRSAGLASCARYRLSHLHSRSNHRLPSSGAVLLGELILDQKAHKKAEASVMRSTSQAELASATSAHASPQQIRHQETRCAGELTNAGAQRHTQVAMDVPVMPELFVALTQPPRVGCWCCHAQA